MSPDASGRPPRVSVGMPAFNREATVARAIESVLSQTFTDFEIVLSDNASTDGTEAICRRYAERDARIRYTRHPEPIGGLPNFRFVLDTARAPYFMWLPVDDYVLPTLLEQAVALLDARPDVVGCVPRTELLDADGGRRPASGTCALLGSLEDNLCRFLHSPGDNSRFYAVYRRSVVQRVLPSASYFAFDWVVSTGTLWHGTHWALDDVLLVREANDPVKYMRMIEEGIANPVARLLPLREFSRALLFDLRMPRTARAIWYLARINVVFHVMYCRHRYPRYGRLAQRVGEALDRLGAGMQRALAGRSRGTSPR